MNIIKGMMAHHSVRCNFMKCNLKTVLWIDMKIATLTHYRTTYVMVSAN